MDADELKEEIAHQRILQKKHRKRLRVLEQQAAKFGDLHVPAHIQIEIDELKSKIAGLEAKITLYNDTVASRNHVSWLPSQKYHSFAEVLGPALSNWDLNTNTFQASVLTSLAHASQAQHVFIVRRITEHWDVVAHSTTSSADIVELLENDTQLPELLSAIVKEPTLSQSSDPNNRYLNSRVSDLRVGQRVYLVVLGNDKFSEVLVFYALAADFDPDEIIRTTLSTLLQVTYNLTIPRQPEAIEGEIYNALKQRLGHFSDFVYERQFNLFKRQLEKLTIFFQPVISLSLSPHISSWEAIARGAFTNFPPADLFRTAELWGTRFKVELDAHILHIAIDAYLYRSNLREARVPRIPDVLPLIINVYSESLVHRYYKEAIRTIALKRKMPLNKLVFAISSKYPISLPTNFPAGDSPIVWLHQELYDLARQGVHFAIVDFDSGGISSSLLQLAPLIVKINSDALFDPTGDVRIKFVLELTSLFSSHIQVIIDGFDGGSRLSLEALYRLGIRYIQGRAVAEARASVYQLDKENVELLRQRISELIAEHRHLKIFLCHASQDKPRVRKLHQQLHLAGMRPWLDEEDLLPGQDWREEIQRSVRNSDIVIVCLSPASITKAGFVQKEIRYALDVADEQPEGAIFIVPLKLEECDVPERLQRWQWVNFFEGKGYERLMRTLRKRAEALGITIKATLDTTANNSS